MKNAYSISFLSVAILGLSFALSYAQNPVGERRILVLLGGGGAPSAHAASHTDGSDDIQDATAAQKGLATTAQITKLDGIEASATADQTDGEIKTAYENNADTEAFTTTEQTKLTGIDTGAQINDPNTVLDDEVNVFFAGQRKQVTNITNWDLGTGFNLDFSNDFDAGSISGTPSLPVPAGVIAANTAQAGEITLTVTSGSPTFENGANQWTFPGGIAPDLSVAGDYTVYYRAWNDGSNPTHYRITGLDAWSAT